MRLNIFFTLSVFIFTGMCISSNPPTEIYHGKKGPWNIYLDLRRETKVVEIEGIKYGFLDILKDTGRQDTIASSEIGILLYKEENYYYRNKELKIEIKLKKKDYTDKIDYMRQKLFEVNAFSTISELKKKDGDNGYTIDYMEIKKDYIYFRDNINIKEDYQPSYILRYYREVKKVN